MNFAGLTNSNNIPKHARDAHLFPEGLLKILCLLTYLLLVLSACTRLILVRYTARHLLNAKSNGLVS